MRVVIFNCFQSRFAINMPISLNNRILRTLSVYSNILFLMYFRWFDIVLYLIAIKIVFYIQRAVNKCTISILIHDILVLLFYTSWKHQKTFRFSDVFRGYRKETMGCNGLSRAFYSLRSVISYLHVFLNKHVIIKVILVMFLVLMYWLFDGKLFVSQFFR